MEQAVLWHKENHIGWITLNRPTVRNAINFEVMEKLSSFLNKAKMDNEIKVVIITGAGTKAFCSGGDLNAFHSLKTEEEAFGMLSKMADVLNELFFFPKPTVALINGSAVGGGCEIATACDIRLARAEAKVGFIQGRLGITTGWGGGSYLLERVRQTEAMDLLYSSSPITAKQGMDLGFIQYVIKGNSKKETERYLRRYTAQPLGVITSYKTLQLTRYDQNKIKQNVQDEVRRCAKLWASDEHHKRVEAFLKKS
ncbi:enoyl-CoA hydratase/isomerase family protein [Fictibacillus phosphorivorans]|uniref:enoyl-CoA hydratase/isomerase family protein n=1 Tax=Fictibacillus phosphorivorans TaxID=1221500 RepID=UPI00203BD78E|nr:enoyl-CoA hydratase/isomerase family protein [Fictibacillus phosphorivorans]MCM3717270.1 enoyl-CoA hydratase/isomerase family protein [Fictibacillus phosphorivorans]MCM3774957.1 enoyl-CoA hydratase/isomerase family protein [Fictibacillus phosphorivorans]